MRSEHLSEAHLMQAPVTSTLTLPVQHYSFSSNISWHTHLYEFVLHNLIAMHCISLYIKQNITYSFAPSHIISLLARCCASQEIIS